MSSTFTTTTTFTRTHAKHLAAKVVAEQGRYRGATSVKQTDFGMSPISIAGGTVKVKDEVTIDFDIATGSKPSTVR